MAAMTDKRLHPRTPLELKVAFVPSRAAARPRRAATRDVSPGGFLMELPAYEPVSQDIRGSLSIPGRAEPLAFEARAQWSRVSGRARRCGFRFTLLSDGDRRVLEGFLESVRTQMLTVY